MLILSELGKLHHHYHQWISISKVKLFIDLRLQTNRVDILLMNLRSNTDEKRIIYKHKAEHLWQLYELYIQIKLEISLSTIKYKCHLLRAANLVKTAVYSNGMVSSNGL